MTTPKKYKMKYELRIEGKKKDADIVVIFINQLPKPLRDEVEARLQWA